MYPRRILLAFSLAASAASVAFADYERIDNKDVDRIEQLSKDLAQDPYAGNDIRINNKMNITIRDTAAVETIQQDDEFDRDSLDALTQKYYEDIGSSNNLSANTVKTKNTNNPYASWLNTHPLPDMTRVSSEFGMRTLMGTTRGHSGVDLAAPSGTPIYATGAGIITKAGWGTGYGQYVEVNHGNGYLTRYAHASRIMVKVGDRVGAGDHIANVGCTGRCTGPHLHFEVVRDGQRKNPSSYLAMLP